MSGATEYDLISLGIDQGIANIGYAVTGLKDGVEVLLQSGTFKTTTKHEFPDRMKLIYEFINGLLETYNVKVMGMEKLFFNPAQGKTRNKSADIMRTNMVTGLLFLLASQHHKRIFDYTPGTVKKYVAGHGHADKELVLEHVQGLAERSGVLIKSEHEADAIAISLTALKQYVEWVKSGMATIVQSKKRKKQAKASSPGNIKIRKRKARWLLAIEKQGKGVDTHGK